MFYAVMHNTHVYLLKHTHAHAHTHFAEERTLAMLVHTKCKKKKTHLHKVFKYKMYNI